MINYLRLFHAAYFTPFGMHPIERDAENNEVPDWGARILAWGPPGGGKTSQLRQLARRMQVICFIMDSTFGEGALGVTPVPDFERNVLRFMRAEFFEIFDGQPGGVFCVDDMTTFAPALQPYLLGMLLNKRIGAHYLPAKVRVFGAANEPLEAPGGWELANAVKNRPCHIQFPDSPIEDWCTGLSRGFNRCDEVVDAEAEEARVLAAFPNAWARAVGYMCGFSMVRRELHRQVEMDGNPLPNAYYTPRTKEFATIALASSYVHGLNSGTTDEFIGGYVGNAFASEFSTYRRAMDLPDPAAFLDGLTSFEHTSSRIDRSSAMMHACCTILEPRDAPKRVDRGKAFVKFLESIGDDSLDSVADIVTTRLFDMNIMESLQGADKGLLRRLRPLLELAEKAKKDVYA